MKTTFFFLFFSTVVLSQNTTDNYIISNNFASEAEYFFHEDIYDSAIYYYQKSFEFASEPHPIQLYKYSKALWRTNQHDEAITQVIKSKMIKIDTSWFSGLSSFQYDSINKQMNDYSSNSRNKNNQERCKNFVDSIMFLDQLVRKNVDWTDSNQVHNLIKQDESNAIALIQFTKKYGFPAGKNIAWDQSVATMLLHMSSTFYEENYELLFKEVVQGNLEPWMLAWGIDRMFAVEVGEDKINPYNRYWKESIINPFLMFYNCVSLGVSPYYDFNWKASPKKTIHFEYYQKNKKHYNTASNY